MREASLTPALGLCVNIFVKHAQRRGKLANVLFDLSKYLLTAVAAASLFTKEVGIWPTATLALLLAVLLITIAWFLTPAE